MRRAISLGYRFGSVDGSEWGSGGVCDDDGDDDGDEEGVCVEGEEDAVDEDEDGVDDGEGV